MKKEKRTYRFQILKGSEDYRSLCGICNLSANMYNSTLYILRNLYFASFPKNGNTPQFYLDQIDENFRKYIVSNEYKYKSKKDNTEKTITFYSIEYPSSSGGKHTNELAFYTIFSNNNHADYRAIQVSAARNAVKNAVKDMKSFTESVKKYHKNSSKFSGYPKLPHYKKLNPNGFKINTFTIDNFKICDDRSITINGSVHLKNVYVPEYVIKKDIKQIRVVPKPTMDVFIVEVIYEKIIDDVITNRTNVMSIDMGIDVVCAVTDMNGTAILVSGKSLKGINDHYNHKIAELQKIYSHTNTFTGKKSRMYERKRTNKIHTAIHQITRFLVDKAIATGCGTIVIGKNDGWKQNTSGKNIVDDNGDIVKTKSHLNKKNRRKFTAIPFNKLISQLKYKAGEYNINVVEVEESYTSKCSALDNEDISKHDEYCGKRSGKHNKTFTTKTGRVIHADINGSLNIMRRAIKKNIGPDGINPDGNYQNPNKVNSIGKESYKQWVQKQM